mgnify:CR=1 FL=1
MCPAEAKARKRPGQNRIEAAEHPQAEGDRSRVPVTTRPRPGAPPGMRRDRSCSRPRPRSRACWREVGDAHPRRRDRCRAGPRRTRVGFRFPVRVVEALRVAIPGTRGERAVGRGAQGCPDGLLFTAAARCRSSDFFLDSSERDSERRMEEESRRPADHPPSGPTSDQASVHRKAEAVAAALHGREAPDVDEVVDRVVHEVAGRTFIAQGARKPLKTPVCLTIRIDDSDDVIEDVKVKDGKAAEPTRSGPGCGRPQGAWGGGVLDRGPGGRCEGRSRHEIPWWRWNASRSHSWRGGRGVAERLGRELPGSSARRLPPRRSANERHLRRGDGNRRRNHS